MKQRILLLLLLSLLVNCQEGWKSIPIDSVKIDTLQGQSLVMKPLVSPQLVAKDSAKVSKYLKALDTYNSNPMNPDFIIWLGRRMAYLGDYQKAIGVFTEGIEKFPDDARMYRHRGHRYITTRQLDLAIKDLETASGLINGQPDRVEPDGMPNALNIPVSSLHTNIYYHLGLAYYLKADWANALTNFENCLQASTNDDMRVAALHWLYMILQRLDRADEADELLKPIPFEMNIIENKAYHMLLLYYKGDLLDNDLDANTSGGSKEAVNYGIAHWHQYNDQMETAMAMYNYLMANGNWAGFGYIAAEAELSRL
ncbi:tetratricopeptide repeat protein [Winogradskyella sp. A2]|uniref:tetratricopeptide repeat protein n=1 Tax=Winogradskyella sp. A2 TaxID=3366944 RepID=UPI00398C35FC